MKSIKSFFPASGQNPIYTICFTLFILLSGVSHSQTEWSVPEKARTKQNPLTADAKTLQKGKKIYDSMCSSCHGKSGKGDGAAGVSLKPAPADFTTSAFKKQPDGAIFYKITMGRGAMASYKELLTHDQRWQVVLYLKSLK